MKIMLASDLHRVIQAAGTHGKSPDLGFIRSRTMHRHETHRKLRHVAQQLPSASWVLPPTR